MEPAKKQEIIEDLVTFSKSKDFYARIGKAWKRGYLLYGPPGTGKSTMIAAMANLLNYDVYDLELTDEDKEKSEKETGKEHHTDETSSKVTLSGLIVFTTNYVEKLDPALIRRGRMDKHIELSYCSFEAFKVLSRNYLRLEAHPLFDKIESLMKETKITPADVAESLMPKSPLDDAEKCLSHLIQALDEAKEAKAATEKADKDASRQNAQAATKAAEGRA
ncbi:hypothetical protein NC652_034939 [Populus alba x Populus x berolinensis]|nr:hypothetical protein NC652_034939 [Populus alba x Populus x berolinensis]